MCDSSYKDFLTKWALGISESLGGSGPQHPVVTIKYADIPLFLQDSDFYKGLSDGDVSEDIVIPLKFFSTVDEVRDYPEFAKLLEVMTFWGVHTFPNGIIEFCHNMNCLDRKAIHLNMTTKLESILNSKLEVGFRSELKEIFCSKDPLMSAIRVGRTEVVEYLSKDSDKCSDPTYVACAASKGKLSCIKILRQNGFEWCTKACDEAAHGHLDCLQYLHENGCAWKFGVYSFAAMYNHWNCFLYAFENGLPWNAILSVLLANCCINSNFLQFAIDHGCPVMSEAVEEAASYGTIDIIRMLLQAGCPVTLKACTRACKDGRIEYLELFLQYGVVWDETVTAAAAKHDQLNCLQYLRDQGCPWNEETTGIAARCGSCSTLRYAMDNGCPYRDDIVVRAAGCVSSVVCLQYLVEERLMSAGTGKSVITAMQSYNPVAVQYLVDNGCHIHICEKDDTTTPIFPEWYFRDHYYVIDKPLLACIKIVVEYNWDLRRHVPSLLRNVLIYSSKVPLLYAYLKAEGYLN